MSVITGLPRLKSVKVFQRTNQNRPSTSSASVALENGCWIEPHQDDDLAVSPEKIAPLPENIPKATHQSTQHSTPIFLSQDLEHNLALAFPSVNSEPMEACNVSPNKVTQLSESQSLISSSLPVKRNVLAVRPSSSHQEKADKTEIQCTDAISSTSHAVESVLFPVQPNNVGPNTSQLEVAVEEPAVAASPNRLEGANLRSVSNDTSQMEGPEGEHLARVIPTTSQPEKSAEGRSFVNKAVQAVMRPRSRRKFTYLRKMRSLSRAVTRVSITYYQP